MVDWDCVQGGPSDSGLEDDIECFPNLVQGGGYQMDTNKYWKNGYNADSKFTMHEFTGAVKFITTKALLMDIEGEEIWLPLSQIEFDDDPIIGMELTVDVPEWLAEKNNLL